MQRKDPYNVCDLAEPRDTQCDIKILMLPMRDGIKLQTIIYFPPELKKSTGVIYIRSPYTRTTEMAYHSYPQALTHNVVTVMQACRGTGWSEGVFDPAESMEYECRDAEDTFNWLKTQSWYNGRCVMTGASYPGWVQWCAMMVKGGNLAGVAPRVAPLYGCTGSARPGGGVSLSFTENWMLAMHHRRKYGYGNVPDYEKMQIVRKLPVIDADKHAAYPELAPLRKFFKKALAPGNALQEAFKKFRDFTAPAYISGGWFDGFKSETIASFMLMKSSAAAERARKYTRLVIGPWGHGGLLNPEVFGEKCDYRHLLKWADRFLFGLLRDPERDPLPGEPAVRYYMLCENKWHEAECWPPAGTVERKFYLHSRTGANSLAGDGTLSEEKPLDEKADVYFSDPAHPVLSNAGTHASLGCHDRTLLQKRSDVLVFTSEKFKEPLTVTGEVKLKFTASSSTPDTDFFATLSWVTPEGKAMLLTTGMVRARFRNIDREELLVPDELYDFELNLSHIAVRFMPGCAMRLEICGQHFPAFDRNANSGGPLLQDTELFVSRHTVYHDSEHPAELILPCLV